MRVVSFNLLLLFCVSCASTSKVENAKTTLEPNAIPFVARVNLTPTLVGTKQTYLVFSNMDIGPLYFRIESSTNLFNWSLFTNVLTFPGLAKVPIQTRDTQRFYRLGL